MNPLIHSVVVAYSLMLGWASKRLSRRLFVANSMLVSIALLMVECNYRGSSSEKGQELLVRKVREELIPITDSASSVNRPYFDGDDSLRWDGALVYGANDSECEPLPNALSTSVVIMRKVRLRLPYVEEVKCRNPDGSSRPEILLAGFSSNGQMKWQRRLSFKSGSHQLDQWLIGASAEGLVLSSLEVWSPETGETIVPAITHIVGTGAEARPVPDYNFTYAALYDSTRKVFYVFEANVSLSKHDGGVYRLNPRTKEKDLLYGVVAMALGVYDHVEAMERSLNGKYLLLAHRQTARGPNSVSFLIFDIEQRAPVYQSRFGEGEFCSSSQIVVGTNGNVGFAYRNNSRKQYYMIHFQIPAGT
jgi:hypothetical protein